MVYKFSLLYFGGLYTSNAMIGMSWHLSAVLSVTFSEVSLLANSKHERIKEKKLKSAKNKTTLSLQLKQTEKAVRQSVSVAMRSCHIRPVMSRSSVMSLKLCKNKDNTVLHRVHRGTAEDSLDKPQASSARPNHYVLVIWTNRGKNLERLEKWSQTLPSNLDQIYDVDYTARLNMQERAFTSTV